MPFITLNNIYKTYNPDSQAAVCALRGLSLTVQEGEMAAIAGTSGSGKSTLLHILSCLDVDFEGEYILDGENIKAADAKKLAGLRNKKVGIVLQNFGLIYDMSVYDNITLPVLMGKGAFDKTKLKTRARELCGVLGIEDKINTRAGRLSGGQKQRAAIARALINDPPLLLADEPTGALDKETSLEIMEAFKELNAQGRTILIVTHDMDIAAMCRARYEITDGKIILTQSSRAEPDAAKII